jgi:hypothetical protein
MKLERVKFIKEVKKHKVYRNTIKLSEGVEVKAKASKYSRSYFFLKIGTQHCWMLLNAVCL